MDSQSWGINVETDTDEPCPHCGDYLKIIEDAVYYVDDDGTQPGYCAACPGCGNAWPWQRTPEQALDAVDRVAVLEQQVAAFTAERDAARAELERLRRPYSQLSYDEWSEMEQNQDWRALAIAFEEDARARHDENEALRAQLSQAHERLDWYAQFSGIPTPPWEQATPAAALTQEEE